MHAPRKPSAPRCLRLVPLLALLALTTQAPAQLTTNNWLLPSGGYWSNDTAWSLGPDLPDSSTEVANFTNDYPVNVTFGVTQTVSLTINGIIFDDTGPTPTGTNDAVLAIRRTGSETLTFDGANPFIDSRTSTGGGVGLDIQVPVNVTDAGLTKVGGGVARFSSTLTGSSTVTVSSGSLELPGNNTNFTGAFVINGGLLDVRNADNNNSLGTTNVGTTINGTGQLRFRDLTTRTFSEPVTINGFNNHGSIKCYASSNVIFNGPVTLNTNGVFSLEQWFSPTAPGKKQDWYFNGLISDDGNARGAHFLNDFQSNNSTGILSRTSEFLLGSANTYGGYTHISAGRPPDGAGPFSSVVRLTNGNDRLPTTSTVILGGLLNTVGHAQGNGRLVLNGYNQELAGLTTLGTGISNRVTGSQAALSTLTLNIGAGTTNTFTGFLGGPDPNDNNLALISRGPGILDLSGANTYAGTTTVTNGTLRVNGTHLGGGNYAIQNGGTLGGTGLIDAVVQAFAGSVVAPGNSIGTLTTSNSFDLHGTLQIELANGAVGLSDMLDVNGFFDITNGTVQFVYTGTLTNDYYVFAEYDALSGPFGSITLPDGYGIDYAFGAGDNQIALFVIPEPSILALLALGLAIMPRLSAFRRRR